MSKHTRGEVNTVGYGSGYIIQEYSVQHLEGRLLTLLESLGLPDKQETAAKGLFRQEAWSLLNNAHYISNEQHSRVMEENAKLDQSRVGSTPARA